MKAKSNHKHQYQKHLKPTHAFEGIQHYDIVNICSICGKLKSLPTRERVIRLDSGGYRWPTRLEEIRAYFGDLPLLEGELESEDNMGGVRNMYLGDAPAKKPVGPRVADVPVFGWQNVWLQLLERRNENSMLSQLFPEGLGVPIEGKFQSVHNLHARTGRGNAFIALHIDLSHRVHIEFYKESPMWILQEVLHRAIYRAESVTDKSCDKPCEAYLMPTTYLLDLEGVLGQEASRPIRLLHQTDSSRTAAIEFPIVCVPARVAILDGLQKIEDLATIRHRVRDLYHSLGGEGDYKDTELFKLCAALSDHRLYKDSGANHGYLDLITADSNRLTKDALQFNPRQEK